MPSIVFTGFPLCGADVADVTAVAWTWGEANRALSGGGTLFPQG